VSGMPPETARAMHRTTISGDYGLGRFEGTEPGRSRTGAVRYGEPELCDQEDLEPRSLSAAACLAIDAGNLS